MQVGRTGPGFTPLSHQGGSAVFQDVQEDCYTGQHLQRALLIRGCSASRRMLAVRQAADVLAKTGQHPCSGVECTACHWSPQERSAGDLDLQNPRPARKDAWGRDPGAVIVKGPGALCTSPKATARGVGAAKSLSAQPQRPRSARRGDRLQSKHEKVKNIQQPRDNALGLPRPVCSFPLRLQTSAPLAPHPCQPAPHPLGQTLFPGPALLPCPHPAEPSPLSGLRPSRASGAEGPARAARGFSSQQTGTGCLQGIPRHSANGVDRASEPRRRGEEGVCQVGLGSPVRWAHGRAGPGVPGPLGVGSRPEPLPRLTLEAGMSMSLS